MGKRYIEGIGWVEEQYRDEWQNGVHLKDYDDAFKTFSKWHALPPYVIDKAIQNVKKGLNKCPDCDDFLHPTNLEKSAPRDYSNKPYAFPNGKYKCKKCAEIQS